MASKTINPTRMELTRLKGRLRTAVRGHRLLKDKRDELMRQFFLIVRENKVLRAKVEAGIEEANRAMTVASSVMSPEMLQQALLYPKQSATLDMTFKNIMSVSVPIYEFHTKSEDAASIYPYGFAQTSGELDDALGALASVFQDMLELAQYMLHERNPEATEHATGDRGWCGSRNLIKPETTSELVDEADSIDIPKGAYVLDSETKVNEFGAFEYVCYLLPKTEDGLILSVSG